MILPWWMIKKDIYNQIIKSIEKYPGLRYYIEHNQLIISGAWPVYNNYPEEKEWLEDFLIKIVFPHNYPTELPKIYETGNRIKPKNETTHFYPDPDNYACLFYPTERYIYFPANEPFQFKKFLEEPVKSFFFSQLYYIYHKKWPFGQRSHNIKGLLEFYEEFLGISFDQKSILTALSYLLKPQIKGHWLCPCGNEKLRKCHVKKFRHLNNTIPKEAIRQDIKFFDSSAFLKLANQGKMTLMGLLIN